MTNLNKPQVPLDNGLPSSLPEHVRVSILKTRTGGWVNRTIQMGATFPTNYEDLPEEYIFDDHTKKLLLEKNGITILREGEIMRGDGVELEGIIPAFTANALPGLEEADYYMCLSGGDVLCIPLVDMNCFTTIGNITTSFPILPQIHRISKSLEVLKKNKGTSILDFYRELYNLPSNKGIQN